MKMKRNHTGTLIIMKTNCIGPETSSPDLRQNWRGDHPYLTSWSGNLADHPDLIPAEFNDHGDSCLEATVPNAEMVRPCRRQKFTGPGKVWIDNFVLYRYDATHDFRPFRSHEISFDEMMDSMPASGKNPAMRFRRHLSPDVYGELAARHGADISHIGRAGYVGPKWETNDSGTTTFEDHGEQMALPGMYARMSDLIAEAAATKDGLDASGRTHYRITAYEGGPSGEWPNEDDPEIDEWYGKSAAMGVAVLDARLFSRQHGSPADVRTNNRGDEQVVIGSL